MTDENQIKKTSTHIYSPENRPRRSETLSKLALALAKAQGQMLNVKEDATGTYGAYATLAATWDAIRKPLADNEITIYQRPLWIEGKNPVMATMILHSSGEFIDDGELEMIFDTGLTKDGKPRMTVMQAMGSAITYARRYTLQAATGVAPTDDDDGEGAGNPRKKSQEKNPDPLPAGPTDAQLKRMYAIASSMGWTHDDVKTFLQSELGLDTSRKLTADQYNKFCEYMEKYPKKKVSSGEPPAEGIETPSARMPDEYREPSAGKLDSQNTPVSTEPRDYVLTAPAVFGDLDGKMIGEISPDDLRELLKWLEKEAAAIPAPQGVYKMVEAKNKIKKFLGIL